MAYLGNEKIGFSEVLPAWEVQVLCLGRGDPHAEGVTGGWLAHVDTQSLCRLARKILSGHALPRLPKGCPGAKAAAEWAPRGVDQGTDWGSILWGTVISNEMCCSCSVCLNGSQVPSGLSPIPLDGQKARLHIKLNKYLMDE